MRKRMTEWERASACVCVCVLSCLSAWGSEKELEEGEEFRPQRAKFLPLVPTNRRPPCSWPKTAGPGPASPPHSSFKALAEVCCALRILSTAALWMIMNVVPWALFVYVHILLVLISPDETINKSIKNTYNMFIALEMLSIFRRDLKG